MIRVQHLKNGIFQVIADDIRYYDSFDAIPYELRVKLAVLQATDPPSRIVGVGERRSPHVFLVFEDLSDEEGEAQVRFATKMYFLLSKENLHVCKHIQPKSG